MMDPVIPSDSPATPPLEVVAAVIGAGGRVLACRRAPGKDAAGSWEFPGGKVEAGERAEAALVREIGEELGVGIRIGALIDRSVTVVHGRAIALSCFHAELTGVRPESSTDHDRMRWVRIRELGALDWALPDLPAMRALLAAE